MSWNSVPFGAIVTLTCLFAQPAAAATPAPAAAPSVYELVSGELHITYLPTGADGRPRLTLVGPRGTLDFSGAGIRTVSAPDVGTLVSVTLVQTVDTGSISLTLVVPPVVLPPGESSTPVSVLGITTAHRFSILRQFDYGQMSTSTQVTFLGVARAGDVTESVSPSELH